MPIEKNKKRIVWIDYLKVFACILVVIGHLIQSLQKSSIDNYDNITSFINWFIYLFHMPLFFAVSGYLYEMNKKQFSWKQYKNFVIKKIINLGVPYIVFYLLYVIINIIFASSVNTPKGIEEIIGIINNPMPPYWFLYALLSIFIFIPLLGKALKENKKVIFIVLIALKIISIFINTKIYLIDSFFENAIYFYLGCIIKDTIITLKNKNIKSILRNVILAIMYILVAIIYYIYYNTISYYMEALINIVFALIGTLICINIFRNIEKCKIFDYLKDYTFQIYLLHTIFAAGFRIILFKIGINNYWIHFIIGFFASIEIPIIIAKICKKTKYFNFFFYPLKTIEKIKEKNNYKGVQKNVK